MPLSHSSSPHSLLPQNSSPHGSSPHSSLPQRSPSQKSSLQTVLQALATGFVQRFCVLSTWRKTASIGVAWIPVFGLGFGLGVVEAGFMGEVAQAYPRTVEVMLERQANEPFTALIERAELSARAAAQQSFDRDILVSEVAVTVLGTSGESVVPILLLNVSRADWRRLPDPQRWATYYNHARELLE